MLARRYVFFVHKYYWCYKYTIHWKNVRKITKIGIHFSLDSKYQYSTVRFSTLPMFFHTYISSNPTLKMTPTWLLSYPEWDLKKSRKFIGQMCFFFFNLSAIAESLLMLFDTTLWSEQFGFPASWIVRKVNWDIESCFKFIQSYRLGMKWMLTFIIVLLLDCVISYTSCVLLPTIQQIPNSWLLLNVQSICITLHILHILVLNTCHVDLLSRRWKKVLIDNEDCP